jgi:hypothetical protein
LYSLLKNIPNPARIAAIVSYWSPILRVISDIFRPVNGSAFCFLCLTTEGKIWANSTGLVECKIPHDRVAPILICKKCADSFHHVYPKSNFYHTARTIGLPAELKNPNNYPEILLRPNHKKVVLPVPVTPILDHIRAERSSRRTEKPKNTPADSVTRKDTPPKNPQGEGKGLKKKQETPKTKTPPSKQARAKKAPRRIEVVGRAYRTDIVMDEHGFQEKRAVRTRQPKPTTKDWQRFKRTR